MTVAFMGILTNILYHLKTKLVPFTILIEFFMIYFTSMCMCEEKMINFETCPEGCNQGYLFLTPVSFDYLRL